MKEGIKEGFIAMVVVLVLGAGYLYFEAGQSSKASVPLRKSLIPPMPALAKKEIPNELPLLPITEINGVKLTTKQIAGKSLLVLFQPDCDHCQREAEAIQKHLYAFEGYTIYFVSDAGLPQISKFAQDYKLAGNPNIHFANADILDIIKVMGPLETPSLFVYTEKGQLVKSFIGETPIEEVLKLLKTL